MDEHTRKHLEAWVEKQFRPYEQEYVFNLMADFLWYADDREYWINIGWWRGYDAASTISEVTK